MTVNLASPAGKRDHTRGTPGGGLTIVAYGDYECPQSARVCRDLRRLEQYADGRLIVVFRNFPLTQIRPHALAAALAAEAAGRQGQFWEMHDMLFEHQRSLEPEDLIAYAQLLRLDTERFVTDMTSDVAAARVREDFVYGIKSGVNGTPTLYINGRRYDGVQTYEALTRQADHVLAR